MEVGDCVGDIYINMSDMEKAIKNISSALGTEGLMSKITELDGHIDSISKAWEDETYKQYLRVMEKRKNELKELVSVLTEHKLVMEYINNTYKLALKSNIELSKTI